MTHNILVGISFNNNLTPHSIVWCISCWTEISPQVITQIFGKEAAVFTGERMNGALCMLIGPFLRRLSPTFLSRLLLEGIEYICTVFSFV